MCEMMDMLISLIMEKLLQCVCVWNIHKWDTFSIDTKYTSIKLGGDREVRIYEVMWKWENSLTWEIHSLATSFILTNRQTQASAKLWITQVIEFWGHPQMEKNLTISAIITFMHPFRISVNHPMLSSCKISSDKIGS